MTTYFFIALSVVLLSYTSLSDLDSDEKDFLYLASVVKEATKGKVTLEEQLKALTKWLAQNVIKTSEYPGWEKEGYPDWFDGSSVASVIKGGIGNCGYQANNVITLSRYLGISQYNRFWVGKSSGSTFEHAFTELVVNGKGHVFDPNILIYQEDEEGNVLGLKEMVNEPSLVKHATFRKIIAEIKETPSILKATRAPENIPTPLGINSYAVYVSVGHTATEMYLHLKHSPLTIITISWFLFYMISSVIDVFNQAIAKTKKLNV
ncbi:transglutaminase domain-containing protein [Colwellia sp. TT2012]|uniref:transglutaminase domain-containing protein n=1 Tax=Colwellia sp. TT2012 TaxID=1720342 RepID=UPI00070EB7F4|nr:transglutaminase domain-containing protein [Colwellia sp. TT2012]